MQARSVYEKMAVPTSEFTGIVEFTVVRTGVSSVRLGTRPPNHENLGI